MFIPIIERSDNSDHLNSENIQRDDEYNLLRVHEINIKNSNCDESEVQKKIAKLANKSDKDHSDVANHVSLNLTAIDYILGNTQIELLHPFSQIILNTNMQTGKLVGTGRQERKYSRETMQKVNTPRRSKRTNRNIEDIESQKKEQIERLKGNKNQYSVVREIEEIMTKRQENINFPMSQIKTLQYQKREHQNNIEIYNNIKEKKDERTNSKINILLRSQSYLNLESKSNHDFKSEKQIYNAKDKNKENNAIKGKRKKNLIYRSESLNSFFKRNRQEIISNLDETNNFEIENSNTDLKMSKYEIHEYKKLIITRRQYDEIIYKKKLDNIISMGHNYEHCKVVKENEYKSRISNNLKRKNDKTQQYSSLKKAKNKTKCYNTNNLNNSYKTRKKECLSKTAWENSRKRRSNDKEQVCKSKRIKSDK